MGASKYKAFPPETNKLAQIARALGHPARIAIIEYLVQQPGCICKDIVNEIPLAQPTISQHLQELKNAGIIKGNVKGPRICYQLDPVTLDDLQGFLAKTISGEIANQEARS